MREYWTRVVGAWVLLIIANRILKSAERIMRETIQTQPELSANGDIPVEQQDAVTA
jgi:hypothetical protein